MSDVAALFVVLLIFYSIAAVRPQTFLSSVAPLWDGRCRCSACASCSPTAGLTGCAYAVDLPHGDVAGREGGAARAGRPGGGRLRRRRWRSDGQRRHHILVESSRLSARGAAGGAAGLSCGPPPDGAAAGEQGSGSAGRAWRPDARINGVLSAKHAAHRASCPGRGTQLSYRTLGGAAAGEGGRAAGAAGERGRLLRKGAAEGRATLDFGLVGLLGREVGEQGRMLRAHTLLASECVASLERFS